MAILKPQCVRVSDCPRVRRRPLRVRSSACASAGPPSGGADVRSPDPDARCRRRARGVRRVRAVRRARTGPRAGAAGRPPPQRRRQCVPPRRAAVPDHRRRDALPAHPPRVLAPADADGPRDGPQHHHDVRLLEPPRAPSRCLRLPRRPRRRGVRPHGAGGGPVRHPPARALCLLRVGPGWPAVVAPGRHVAGGAQPRRALPGGVGALPGPAGPRTRSAPVHARWPHHRGAGGERVRLVRGRLALHARHRGRRPPRRASARRCSTPPTGRSSCPPAPFPSCHRW